MLIVFPMPNANNIKNPDQVKVKGEKLQKVLAREGMGSRREIEHWIREERVSVNGEIARLGDRINAKDRVLVDGKLIFTKPKKLQNRCIIYHKPAGQICTRKDPKNRRSVFDNLPKLSTGRWVSVGRLDYNTSGIMLFTTDGNLANSLMHPSSQIEREYVVRVKGQIEKKNLENMINGVILEDGIARFTDIQAGGGIGSNRWFYVVIMEGRNREVRRLWESQGLIVSRLKRVRFGPLIIPSELKRGEWKEVSRVQIKKLYQITSSQPKENI